VSQVSGSSQHCPSFSEGNWYFSDAVAATLAGRAAKFSAYGVYVCVSDKATSTRHSRRFIKVAMNLARAALISPINSLYDSKNAVCVHNTILYAYVNTAHGALCINCPMTMGEMRLRWIRIMHNEQKVL
jgi:hypothetical protein